LRVQAGGGFVEEQHLGAVHDGPGDHQPLCHPAGQIIDPFVGGVCQADLIEQPGGGGAGGGWAHPEVTAVEDEGVEDVQAAVQCVAPRDHANVPVHPGRRRGDVDTGDPGPARGRPHGRGQYPGGWSTCRRL
jgi:hypothetical protein